MKKDQLIVRKDTVDRSKDGKLTIKDVTKNGQIAKGKLVVKPSAP